MIKMALKKALRKNHPHISLYNHKTLIYDELTDSNINQQSQFLYDKHEKMYTAGVNYSYLSYPKNSFRNRNK